MAHHLCSSPSSLSHNQPLSRNCYSSPNLLPLAPFRPLPILRNPSRKLCFVSPQPRPSPSLLISKVSVQDPAAPVQNQSSDYQSPDVELASNSSKRNIWVNPNNPRASNLRRKSYASRYSSLVEISESLNSCNASEEDVRGILNSNLGNKIVERDAVIILNNMTNLETTPIVLNYFLQRLKSTKEVVLYNVTLKVFRNSGDLERAEKLFDEMLERGVKPDKFTFSTIIGCARSSSLPEKAVEWFGKMPDFGCEPDGIIHAVMIDVYGRVGNIDMALSLYDRSRTEKWPVDAVSFATLLRIYNMSGNYDGCANVYEEMKALDVKPNLAVYNIMMDAMGKAKRPWHTKAIYEELLNNGFKPSWRTYASLLRTYCRVRYSRDALSVYREMKEKGMGLNIGLYNSLLSVCANFGLIDEASEILEDLKSSQNCKPDNWTYSSFIKIYSCSGDVPKAEATLKEMLEAGFEPDIFIMTSLIQCYGTANRTDDVVRTFNELMERGITPDDQLCCSLLNVMRQMPKEELCKLTKCIEKANSSLGSVVTLLMEGENVNGEIFKKEARDFFDSTGVYIRRAYCNSLIDLSINLNTLERACDLLDLGLTLELYADIQSKSPVQWSLHLKGLSLGAALTALHVWMNDLTNVLENGGDLPSVLGINTGHRKHKYSEKGLVGAFQSHFKELNSPFHEDPDKPGWFLTTGVAAKSWLEARRSREAAAA